VPHLYREGIHCSHEADYFAEHPDLDLVQQIKHFQLDEHAMLKVNGIYKKIENNYVPASTRRIKYHLPEPHLFTIGEEKSFYYLYTISHIDHHCSDSQLSSIETGLKFLTSSERNILIVEVLCILISLIYDFAYTIADKKVVSTWLISVICIGLELCFAGILYKSYASFTSNSLECLGKYGEFAREFSDENQPKLLLHV
jgi:hypothetical protein